MNCFCKKAKKFIYTYEKSLSTPEPRIVLLIQVKTKEPKIHLKPNHSKKIQQGFKPFSTQ